MGHMGGGGAELFSPKFSVQTKHPPALKRAAVGFPLPLPSQLEGDGVPPRPCSGH